MENRRVSSGKVVQRQVYQTGAGPSAVAETVATIFSRSAAAENGSPFDQGEQNDVVVKTF